MILTHGRQLTPKHNLQLSGGVEYSELEQTGDAENKRTFTRPKGSASLSWQQSDTLKLVSREMIQLHGGIGMTDEFDVGLFMKRVRVLNELLGDAHFHAERLARAQGF